MLHVTEGEQLEHADHIDAVVDGDEHRRVRVVLDLAQCVHVVPAVLGSVVVAGELAAEDQLDQRVDVAEGCGAERDVHVGRQ